jgi:hypothetical protein
LKTPDEMRLKIAYGFGLLFVSLVLLFVAWPNFALDLMFCDSYGLKCDLRGLLRRHEKLPAVVIENGDVVYCRMYMCDFRFPLPDKVRIVRIAPVTGGGDTIDGAIYVVVVGGGSINMRKYAELLQGKHFDASPTDGSGCPDVTNNIADVPFVSAGRVIHYPLFDDFFASSADQEGGIIEVNTENRMTKIRFSYFGDY